MVQWHYLLQKLSVTMAYDRQIASMRKYEILEKSDVLKNWNITINEY